MSELDDFSYEDSTHEYRNAQGILRPGATLCLKASGLVDWSKVKPDVIERKRRIGKNVHDYSADHDRSGEIDMTWVADDELGYFNGWLRFLAEAKPTIHIIEKPMFGTICGMEIGGTPDRILELQKRPFIIDIKCAASKHPAWAVQLAIYEMLHTRRDRCGHMGRMVVQLFPDGRYTTIEYTDPGDASAAIAALTITTWKQNAGMKLAA